MFLKLMKQQLSMLFSPLFYLNSNLNNSLFLINNQFNTVLLNQSSGFLFLSNPYNLLRLSIFKKVSVKNRITFSNSFIDKRYFLKTFFLNSKVYRFGGFKAAILLRSSHPLLFNQNRLSLKTAFMPNFFNYSEIFLRNWNFLIGSPLSPFFTPILSENFISNISVNFLLKKLSFKTKFKINITKKVTTPDLFNKIHSNPFFYAFGTSVPTLKSNQTHYVLKYDTASVNTSEKSIFLKPYQFLYNNNYFKSTFFYPNYYTINIFNQSSRHYFLFKKTSNIFRLPSINLNTNFKQINRNFLDLRFEAYSNRFDIMPDIRFNNFYSNFGDITLLSVDLNSIDKSNNFKFKTRSLRKLSIFKHAIHFDKNQFNRLSLFRLLNRKSFKWSKSINLLKSIFMYKSTSNIFLNLSQLSDLLQLQPSLSQIQPFFYKTPCFLRDSFDGLSKWQIKNNYILNDFLVNRIFVFKPILVFSLETSNIFKNFKKIVFFSKEKNKFLSGKYGFLFLNSIFSFSSNNSKFINDIKTTLFSFAYKNEMQRYILKRYFKNNIILNLTTNYSNFGNNADLFNEFELPDSPDDVFRYLNKNFFQYYINPAFKSTKWSHFYTEFEFDEDEISIEDEEYNYNLKRIKFKPGYMTIWRNARNVVKTSLNLKLRYQYRLTRFLNKFNKLVKFKSFLFFELTLLNTIVKSRILPDLDTSELFLKNGLFFLNGSVCIYSNLLISIGDLVQLIISFKYYILYKWLINWNLKKKNRLKTVSRKKLFTQIDYEDKQKSRNIPKWVLKNRHLFADTPNYLELDFFTLSFIILYEPFLWNDINYYHILDTRFQIINMYNWKYLV